MFDVREELHDVSMHSPEKAEDGTVEGQIIELTVFSYNFICFSSLKLLHFSSGFFFTSFASWFGVALAVLAGVFSAGSAFVMLSIIS